MRRYSSDDPVLDPDPALDPAAYNQSLPADVRRRRTAGCRSTGRRRRCALSTRAGMHRFSWDLRYDPIGVDDAEAGGDDDANGAVPHRTYPSVVRAVGAAGHVHRAPDGRRQELHAAAHAAARSAREDAGRRRSRSSRRSRARCTTAPSRRTARRTGGRAPRPARLAPGPDVEAFRAQVESLAPAPARPGAAPGRVPARFRRGAAAAAPTLEAASSGSSPPRWPCRPPTSPRPPTR